ncbi:MAG: tryptophan--tRNA ligase [Candidatus Aenigmarchaeota archaeon]|nr:tryptophan--tRNA ligase [Candidatus Aenigmarchaeota archaeon]
MPQKFTVTPWEVKGELDYEKLIKQFGTKLLDEKILNRLKKHTGKLHFMLRRKIFFSHRDFDWILDKYEEGEKFVLYTGRGPSGHTHIGHLVPWVFTKWLQDKFDTELYFQLTDDEKFLVKPLSLKETTNYAMDNILDIIAMGFKPKKTHIIVNTLHIDKLYRIALKVSKHLTFSTVKAVFGFKNSSNIGIIFFPSMQIAPCFLPSEEKGHNVPVLIPAAIDQDPYWRPARDVAPKLGYYKPAQIHSKFIPGLGKEGKMSASKPETAIFTTDKPEDIRRKILNAFTGGRETAELQRKYGGNPDVCSVYKYYYFFFEEDDKKLKEIYEDCKSGRLLCGECKLRLIKKVEKFLEEHQKRRKKAKQKVDKFLIE